MDYLIKSADFSECGRYRYVLRRIWDDNLPRVMCIGLNPSTANAQDDDPTIRNLVKFLAGCGYGGLMMMNLFALVSSSPEDLRMCPDPVKDNDRWLQEIGAGSKEVIFCWGSFPQGEWRIKKVEGMFPAALCLGKTAKGKPLHPLAATVWQRSKCRLQEYKPKL